MEQKTTEFDDYPPMTKEEFKESLNLVLPIIDSQPLAAAKVGYTVRPNNFNTSEELIVFLNSQNQLSDSQKLQNLLGFCLAKGEEEVNKFVDMHYEADVASPSFVIKQTV